SPKNGRRARECIMLPWSQIPKTCRKSYPQGGFSASLRPCPGENEDMPEPSEMAPRFLAPAQVAELLSIEIDEVVDLVQQGRLRGSQLGSPPRWRIEELSLSDYLSEQSEEA